MNNVPTPNVGLNLNVPNKNSNDTIVIKDTLVIKQESIPNVPIQIQEESSSINNNVENLNSELSELKKANAQREKEYADLLKTVNELKLNNTSKIDTSNQSAKDLEIVDETYNVFFEVNQSKVGVKYQIEIINFINTLKQYPELNLVLKGYADKTGNAVYNQQLSEKRVDSVEQFILNNLNINSNRISKQFFGSEGGERYNTLDLNRRVELSFTK